MTNPDWNLLYKTAKKVFRKGKFMLAMDQDDFAQECAVVAMRNQHKEKELGSVVAFVNYIVHNCARSFYHSDNNYNKRLTKMWAKERHETAVPPEYFDAFDRGSESPEDTLISNIDTATIKKTMKNILKPLDFKIFVLKLGGSTNADIGRILSVSRQFIGQRTSIIEETLINRGYR